MLKTAATTTSSTLMGGEARDLYNIIDPTAMVQFLKNQNVTIIVDVMWARTHGHFNILPMAKYLGSPSPFFPTIFNNNSNPAIYNVGPFQSPLTDNSSNLVSLSQAGWSPKKTLNGIITQSVLVNNDSAKLYVSTPSILTSVNITYLDMSSDVVSVNLHNLKAQNWTEGYTVIERNNTGQWRSCQFLVSPGEEGYVELGLHAFGEDLAVSKIDVSPYQSPR